MHTNDESDSDTELEDNMNELDVISSSENDYQSIKDVEDTYCYAYR